MRSLLLASTIAMLAGCAPTQTYSPQQVSSTAGMTACADLTRDPTITNPSLIAECQAYRNRLKVIAAREGIPVCDTTIMSPTWCRDNHAADRGAPEIVTQSAADRQLDAARAKRDAGKKLTAKDQSILAKAEAADAAAYLAAQDAKSLTRITIGTQTDRYS